MNLFEQQDQEFTGRHIGPGAADTKVMLQVIGAESLEGLVDKTIPPDIRMSGKLETPPPVSEYQYLEGLRKLAAKNKICKNYIGMGYHPAILPPVIRRNVFENPGWYTPYTPYQAEIAQGRLECLLTFQTLVSDLTGLPLANASLLDEGTAAAEAMHMCLGSVDKEKSQPTRKFFVDEQIFPQTRDILIGRAGPSGIELVFGDFRNFQPDEGYFGILLQYPDDHGEVRDYRVLTGLAHHKHIPVVMATDLLALTLLTPPGELGADLAVGSAQRFGIPLGYGGPHAAFLAASEQFKRFIPGRIIGVSEDAGGRRALRMALQTREQHIRREKATSNICTAQALLANMSALYAVYHGPDGLKNIALRISLLARGLAKALESRGFRQLNNGYFDTLRVEVSSPDHFRSLAERERLNFRYFPDGTVGVSVNETTTRADIDQIMSVFLNSQEEKAADKFFLDSSLDNIPASLTRKSPYLLHPVFNSHHSETRMMRYIRHLESRDLALNTSMIPLGSCTMKLNSTTELIPLGWPEWADIHPFVPPQQAEGYQQMLQELDQMLQAITGFAACSLQPNSGAQGEYTGLMVIKAYLRDIGEVQRNIVLIPVSAHGTNPASAVMAGMQVITVNCDDAGNIDLNDLESKARANAPSLAALMVTYPSTHGVFEVRIKEICQIIHANGGQVYMDGANLNAQVGLTSPALTGADVCHLNLHKTFAIPHGGGGPGMGPIGVAAHLAAYLPGHPQEKPAREKAIHAVAAAPFSSASILLISYGYIRLLGPEGLRLATAYAILNANYMKALLAPHFQILFAGAHGFCAHEFILDLRPFRSCGVEAEDVAKRLMDYSFHAPTLSFPVPGTLMIEPTESEDKAELDRFCQALIAIRAEIADIESGKSDRKDNPLHNAPHTQADLMANDWSHPYSRQQAAFPLDFLWEHKFWPAVGRLNNTLGDRNLVCTCEPTSSYAD